MYVRSIGLVGGVLLAAFVGVGASFAEDMEPIAARKALMKSVGGSAKLIGGMLEGKEAYDAAKATEALTAMQKAGIEYSTNFDKLFPMASKDGDTTASAAVWEKSEDFKTKAKQFGDDATAAIEAVKVDEASFKAAAGKVFGNCKGCHETFRKPM